MATHINKRKLRRETDVIEVYGKHRGKKIIIELLPSGEICFRVKGTRQSFTMHIAHAYAMAQVVETESRYTERMKLYKARAIRRRPKRPFYPVASKYLRALLG